MLLNIKRRLFIIDPSPREKTKAEGEHPSQRAVEAAVAGSSLSMAKPPTPHHDRSIDKTNLHHRSTANFKKNDDAERQLNGNGGDNSSRDHQLKKHSSSSSRHHERTRRPPSSEEQSFSSFNTTSTHPSTSNGDDVTVDVDYDDYEDGYGQYTAYESKGPSSRASSRSSSSSRRKRRSCSPTKSRSRSSRSSSSRQHHHHTH